MAKRDLPEINAGSMADIAFLLLIFFLVTTTMDQEVGIKRQLPQEQEKSETDVVKTRNVLEILTTSSDYSNVENALNAEVLLMQGSKFDDVVKIREIKDFALEFLHNKNDSKDLPVYNERTTEECKIQIERIRQEIAALPSDHRSITILEKNKEKWEERLNVCQVLGGKYREISEFAFMAVKLNPLTNYDVYIQIQAQLEEAQNELRDEFAQKYFGVSYYNLDEDIDEDYERLKILKHLVPQRILKGENL